MSKQPYQSRARYRGKFDTPTDAISRKAFDRYKDQQERRYGQLKQRLLDAEHEIVQLKSWFERIAIPSAQDDRCGD